MMKNKFRTLLILLMTIALLIPVALAVQANNIQVSGQSSSGFTVSWSTDVPASSQVFYGSSGSVSQSTNLVSSLVTSHQVQLSGLSSDALTFFRVAGRDANGNSYVSPVAVGRTTGTTNTGSTTNTGGSTNTPITNVETTVIDGGFQVTWSLSSPSTGQIYYGNSPSLGQVTPKENGYLSLHIQRPQASSGTYYFKIVGTTQSGQSFESQIYSIDVSSGTTTGTTGSTGSTGTNTNTNTNTNTGSTSGSTSGGFTGSASGATGPSVTPPGASPSTFVACTPGNGAQYTPTSASDISNPSNAGKTAVISSSFTCTGCTFASGQTIIPNGGVISGTNINTNGACIQDNYRALFSSSSRLSPLYTKSRLSPEAFGANGADNTDDKAAIDAMILNSVYARSKPGATYIKNDESTYDRGGLIDWDWQNSRIITTSDSNIDNDRQNTAIFNINRMAVRMENGEFDGQRKASRFMRMDPVGESYYFENMHVHNLYMPLQARATGFFFGIRTNTAGFRKGEFYNNLVEDIEAQSDFVANNAVGISTGVMIYNKEDGPGANIYHSGNTIRNIEGDDATGYLIGPYGRSKIDHDVNYYFDNERMLYSERRQFKVTDSNFHLTNSYIETAGDPQDFNGEAAAGVHVFSTGSEDVVNTLIQGNTFYSPGPNFHSDLLSITNANGFTIKDNSFESKEMSFEHAIGFGSGPGGKGSLSNGIIEDNTIKNGYIVFLPSFAPHDTLIFDNNNIEIDYTSAARVGQHVGAIFFSSYNGAEFNTPIIFRNAEIKYNGQTSNALWRGAFASRTSTIKNFRMENVDITYTGSNVAEHVGYVNGNFDNSNVLSNVRLHGASGSNSITITGSGSPTIQNSYGDGNTPITVS